MSAAFAASDERTSVATTAPALEIVKRGKRIGRLHATVISIRWRLDAIQREQVGFAAGFDGEWDGNSRPEEVFNQRAKPFCSHSKL
jgi:hypothetical protein